MCGLPSILALIPAHMRVSFPRGVGVETHSLTLDAPTPLLSAHMMLSRSHTASASRRGLIRKDKGETWRQRRSTWQWPLDSRRA